MEFKEIWKFANDRGYPRIEKDGKWRGYDVYIPVFEEIAYIGLPLFVMVKGDDIRMSTPDEAMARLRELEE